MRGEIHLIYFFNLRHFGDAQRGNNSTQLETDGAARGGNTGLGDAERGLGNAVVGGKLLNLHTHTHTHRHRTLTYGHNGKF